jgi:hypothetical protein
MTHQSWQCLADPANISLFQRSTGNTGEATNHAFTELANTVRVSPDFWVPWTVQDEYKLLAKLLEKVKGHSFNVGVSLAEVDKLSEGVISTIKTVGLGFGDLAKGNFSSFARRFGASPPSPRAQRSLTTKDFSGRFLEMRYAWEPTIQDTFEAAKAFEALSNGPRQVVIKATHRKKLGLYIPTNYARSRASALRSKTYTYEAYEELSAFRQMGLANPASILWERIPYSFVIDWFIPIGTYLELIGQIPFLKGRFMLSDYFELVSSGKVVDDPLNAYGMQGIKVPDINLRTQQLTRTLPPSLSVPAPSIRVAGAVQGRRIGNAIALAHQLLNRALPLFKAL